MASDPKQDNNQRQFVRIDDMLPFSYRLLSEEEMREVGQYYKENRTFPRSGEGVGTILAQLDVTEKLQQLERQDRNLAQLLRQIDIKLNMLLHLFHPDEHERPLVPTQVNISGGGLAFFDKDPQLKPNDPLELRVAFSAESLVAIDCYARVVRVFDPNAQGMVKVACRFDPILDADRERIIQHIFKRQSEILRSQRQKGA